MSTVTTTTVLESLRYPSESAIDRDQSGNLWMVKRTTATSLDVFKSVDNGATWGSAGITTYTNANLQDTSGIFIDTNNNIHMAIRTFETSTNVTDNVYYLRLVSGNTTWDNAVAVYGVQVSNPGQGITGLSIAALTVSSTYVYIAMCQHVQFPSPGTQIRVATGSYAGTNGTYSVTAMTTSPINFGDFGSNMVPSIDFENNGNPKVTVSTVRVHVAWGMQGSLRIYSLNVAGTLTGTNGDGGVALTSNFTATRYSIMRWYAPASRLFVTFAVTNTVRVDRLDTSFTVISTTTSPTHPQGNVTNYTSTLNTTNGDMRVYAVGTTNSNLYYVNYTASGNTWGSWTLISPTPIVGVWPNNFSARRTNYSSAAYDLVLAQGSSPYTISYSSGGTTLSPPNTAVITAPASSGISTNVAQSLTLSWTFSDTDSPDSQSAYAIRRTIGAVVRYWNQTGGTWDVAETYNTSATSSKTWAAGWGNDSDATHNYAVKTKDSTGLASTLYSTDVTVVPAAVFTPTITAPSGSIVTPTTTATWTVGSQSTYRVELLDPSLVVVYDSGTVTSAATSLAIPYTLHNGVSYTVRLTTAGVEGLLAAPVTSAAFSVTFTLPHSPTSVTITPSNSLGGITILIANGTPTGSEPAFTGQAIYRRIVGDTSAGIRVANNLLVNSSFLDFKVASGVNYEYSVLVTGNSGATRQTSWSS